MVLVCVYVFGACGDKPGGHGAIDATIPCEGDEDCPGGMICVGNICETLSDASTDVPTATEPQIEVQPSELDFGFAPLRVDTTLPLTIRNTGNGDLEITAILVEEVDQLLEYHASPEGVQSPPIVVAPGEETTVQVTLRPEDGELDAAQLRINSNDPDEGSITVPLTSGYKGNPELKGCVLDFAVTEPEPFTDCTVADVTEEPIIDFGVVQFQEDASQLVVARNVADGNAPLTVSDIVVTNDTGMGFHFSLELFWLEEGPGGDSTEIPAELPVFLRAADPLEGLTEDRLYIRIVFDGDMDGLLPDEHLVLSSNDAAGELRIPIYGVVSGCPTGTWDINGDPNDGCEYVCDYDGPEVCDSVDNDCDGEIDSEDSIGCTVYFRDTDNDNYGLTSDSRCLCQPDQQTHHTATVDGDCDDTQITVNPGAVEQCGTAADDDCDGDTNDENAAGCTLYYADADSDTYGVTTDTACYCLPTGVYTALQSGDCDDTNPLPIRTRWRTATPPSTTTAMATTTTRAR